MVSKEDIQKEAKEIMDNFMNAMADIEVEENFNLVREESYRNETEPLGGDDEFISRFISNVPKSRGNAVIANKGEWNNK